MAHLRSRHILTPYEKLIKFARILGVIGHRQTGKSTFVEKHALEYVTLDSKPQLDRAETDPVGFIESLKGKKSAIDECQLVPDLFPALKVKIGTSQIPGRYILTGSVRFSSRNAIRESLTGRIINQEMLPLVCTELAEEPNSKMFIALFGGGSLQGIIQSIHQPNDLHRSRLKMIDQYAKTGGLPGICFVRSEQTRKNILRDILETILDRDIRLIYPTTLPLEQIRALCEQLSLSPFEPISYQDIRRETGISPATTKKLINAMENVFLIRRIPLIGDRKGEFFWFEDQVERHYFAKTDDITEVDWVSLFYRNFRAQYLYRVGEFAEVFHYRTRGGARVPLVIKSKKTWIGFFVVNQSDEITRSMIHSAESFISKYENSRVVFILKNENRTEMLTETLAMIPMTALLFE